MALDQNQVTKGVNALVKHVKAKGAQAAGSQNELFEDEQLIWLQIGLKSVPDPKKKPFKIDIPHGVLSSDAEICLITKDPQKDFKQLIAEKGIKNITKVIGVSKLREKYKAHEQKRQLCDLYDVFLADERVLPMLPKLLGKTFFAKKKQPLSVNLQKTELAAEIKAALNATYLYLGLGSCASVKIGHTGHSTAQIVENIVKGMDEIAQRVPGKWKAIQSIHIKTANSTSLPIFNSLPFSDAGPAEANEEPEKKPASTQSKASKKEPAAKETPAAKSKASKKTPAAKEKPAPATPAPAANGKTPKAAKPAAAATPASGKTPKAKTPAAKATPAQAKTPAAKSTPAPKATPAAGGRKTPARTPGTAAKRAAAATDEPKSAKKRKAA